MRFHYISMIEESSLSFGQETEDEVISGMKKQIVKGIFTISVWVN